MPNKNNLDVVEGYREAQETIKHLSPYGVDYSTAGRDTQNLINRYHPKRLQLRLSEIIDESPSTKTLRLVSQDGYLPPFQAGQYINLFVTIDGVHSSRPYAISSSPWERGHYDLTIKNMPQGFVSPYLTTQVTPGQHFESTGPMGSFYYNPLFHGNNLVFLAGGSGITPAMSMIQDLIVCNDKRHLHIIYGSRGPQDVIFHQALDRFAALHNCVSVSHVFSEPPEDYTGERGFVTAELIERLTGKPEGKTYYICGPQIMNEFCRAQLSKLGALPRQVRVEANGPPARPESRPGWPDKLSPDTEVTVTVKGDKSFRSRTGEPLLNAMERNGINVEAACRSGECSMCRVKVERGAVFEPTEAHLRKTDSHYGYTHACVCYPTEDIEISI